MSVGLDRFADHAALVVGRQKSGPGSWDGKVCVADVPLAPVVRLIAAGAEPVAERGDRIGVEPTHTGIVVVLRDPVGLGHAV